jgi:hypothetical protein
MYFSFTAIMMLIFVMLCYVIEFNEALSSLPHFFIIHNFKADLYFFEFKHSMSIQSFLFLSFPLFFTFFVFSVFFMLSLSQITDLESALQHFINLSFENITSIEHSLQLLRKFQSILQVNLNQCILLRMCIFQKLIF